VGECLHVIMAVHLHEVGNGIEWRSLGRVRFTANADLHEVCAIAMVPCELRAELVDGEVVGPDRTVGAGEHFFL
jgi:hypothetical protein